MKCKFCKRDMSLSFVEEPSSSKGSGSNTNSSSSSSSGSAHYTIDDTNQWKTMVKVDCRGMELVRWMLHVRSHCSPCTYLLLHAPSCTLPARHLCSSSIVRG